MSLLRELGYAQVQDGNTVYLWPQKCQKKNPPPLVLRLIVLVRKGKPIYLVTNASEASLGEEQASVLYEMRWGVEVFYRSMKQTLSHRKMLSGAPGQARMELEWTMVGMQLLGLLSVEQILARGKDPLSWSVALSVRAVRRAMRDRPARATGRGGLLAALGQAVGDGYIRRAAKTARDWPHKKNDPPAGPPRIRQAAHAEVQRAERIRTTTQAA